MIIEQTTFQGNIKRLTHSSNYYYCIHKNGEVLDKSKSIEDYNTSNLVLDTINDAFGSDSFEELENEIINRV